VERKSFDDVKRRIETLAVRLAELEAANHELTRLSEEKDREMQGLRNRLSRLSMQRDQVRSRIDGLLDRVAQTEGLDE
jgi:chromosome segregation ATPase